MLLLKLNVTTLVSPARSSESSICTGVRVKGPEAVALVQKGRSQLKHKSGQAPVEALLCRFSSAGLSSAEGLIRRLGQV